MYTVGKVGVAQSLKVLVLDARTLLGLERVEGNLSQELPMNSQTTRTGTLKVELNTESILQMELLLLPLLL